MGDRYRKLSSGASVTKFSRTVYNETIDMLRWWKQNGRTAGGGVGAKLKSDRATVECENVSGTSLSQFAVVGVYDIAVTPTENLAHFQNRSTVQVTTPIRSLHATKFGITVEPCSYSDGTRKTVRVCFSGVMPVLLNVSSGDHEYATLDSSSSGSTVHLVSSDSGVPILWKDTDANEDANGDRWALVMLGPRPSPGPQHKFFQLKTSLAPGSQATAYGLVYEGGSWVVDAKYLTDLFIMGDGVEGETGKHVAAFNEEFSSSDIGETLGIIAGDGFTVADIEIEDVTTIAFGDLVVVDGDAKKVSSVSGKFSELHVGLVLHITKTPGSTGDTWTVGEYNVVGFDSPYLILDALPASEGTVGGIGYLTPYATLSGSAGTPGSTGGQAVCGTFTVSDAILNCHRAYGSDDLLSQCNRIHLTDRTINGTRYTEISGAGGLVTITDLRDEENLFPGFYWTITVYDETAEENVTVLNRPATTVGQEYEDVLGYQSTTAGAAGLALRDTDSSSNVIIALTPLARIVSGVTAQDVTITDTECNLVFIQAMDGGQSPICDDVIQAFNDVYVPEGHPDQIATDSPAFNANDIGTVFYLRGIPRTVEGWYTILDVDVVDGIGTATLDRNCVVTYTDFEIELLGGDLDVPPDDNDKVTSATASPGEDDIGLLLTITGGTGFTAADYDVDDVDTGIMDLSAVAGDEGSTGGTGYFTGMAGGTAVSRKPLVIKTNGWTGPAGSTVTILWNESGDTFLLDYDEGANDDDHEEDYYQIVREYPAPPATGDWGLIASNGVLAWREFTEELECPAQEA